MFSAESIVSEVESTGCSVIESVGVLNGLSLWRRLLGRMVMVVRQVLLPARQTPHLYNPLSWLFPLTRMHGR